MRAQTGVSKRQDTPDKLQTGFRDPSPVPECIHVHTVQQQTRVDRNSVSVFSRDAKALRSGAFALSRGSPTGAVGSQQQRFLESRRHPFGILRSAYFTADGNPVCSRSQYGLDIFQTDPANRECGK